MLPHVAITRYRGFSIISWVVIEAQRRSTVVVDCNPMAVLLLCDRWLEGFVPDSDQIVSKTDITRVEGENPFEALLSKATSQDVVLLKSLEMLKHSIDY